MPNGNYIKSENFVSKTKIYIAIIGILLIVYCNNRNFAYCNMYT